jgi:hypothetical protein
MSYKKPEVAFLNVREQATMASGKKECGDRGCCVKSLENY